MQLYLDITPPAAGKNNATIYSIATEDQCVDFNISSV